jgi:8-oxo-dGTP diphosphatase
MGSAETMRVCAGGLLVRGDEILLAKRAADRTFYPGVWDMVGGHCEGDETPAETLGRELEEEIGVRPSAFEEIAVLEEPRPVEHGQAQYHVFVVTAWDGGEPRLLGSEHSELRWLSLEKTLALPLAHPGYADLFRAILSRGGLREEDI